MVWQISTVDITGASPDASLLAVRGRECLSQPFSYEVEFEAAALDHAEARCSSAHLTFTHEDGTERHVSGMIEQSRTSLAPVSDRQNFLRHRVVLRPTAYLSLSRRYGYRIFQDKTVPDIVREVLEHAGVPEDATDWGGVVGTYPERVYCVQYDETDWDFISRLLEFEGIYYCFDHQADGHLMRFCDDPASVETSPTATFHFAPRVGPQDALPNHAWAWRSESRLSETKATLRDFDMLRPSLDLTAEATADDAIDREYYEYPGGYIDPAEGARLAQTRIDALRATRDAHRMSTNAAAVLVGQKVEVLDHPSVDGELLFVEATFEMNPTHRAGVELRVDAVAIDASTTFRPPRLTSVPQVVGFQVARVCGPEGSEIHVDEHGRIKVQFPWDREGQQDDRSTCWLRVNQPNTTGSIMIPRVTWEVLVEFQDGDPDRPLCLGRLWNPMEPPPVSLPAEKTMTQHGSSSSPGRTGQNKISMNDAAGSEQLSISGHADINTVVANNRMFSAGNAATRNVNGDREANVGADETGSVGGDLSSECGASQTVSISGTREINTDGTAAEEVTSSYDHTVGGIENIQVGSPGAALLEVIASAAIGAATSRAASAASRAQSALMGPIAPAMARAQGAVGQVAQFAGPATALLGGGNPNVAAFSQAAGALSNAPGAIDAGQTAAGIANSAAAGALAAAGISAAGGGSGTWSTTVGGAVTEKVGGANVVNSASGITFGIGGSNTEVIGAARVELVRGGKSETTGGAKIETTGVYMVNAKDAASYDAKAAIALNIAAGSKRKVSGGHSISAEGPVVVNAPKLKLKASGTITLKCGSSEVVIEGGGVSMDAAVDLKIEGGQVKITENALGS